MPSPPLPPVSPNNHHLGHVDDWNIENVVEMSCAHSFYRKMICGEEREGGLCLIYLIYKIDKHLENNVETLSHQLSLCWSKNIHTFLVGRVWHLFFVVGPPRMNLATFCCNVSSISDTCEHCFERQRCSGAWQEELLRRRSWDILSTMGTLYTVDVTIY